MVGEIILTVQMTAKKPNGSSLRLHHAFIVRHMWRLAF